jgi:peroxiredoxin
MDAKSPTHPLRRAVALGVFALALAAPVLAYETGEAARPFSGTDASGKTQSLSAHKGKTVVVVVWGSSTCKAYARHLAKLSKRFSSAVWLGVAPNGGESAAGIRQAKSAQGITFPIIVDAGGPITKGFGAKMMPSVYVIGAQGKVRYQGAIVDNPGKPKQHYLANALQALANGQSPPQPKTRVRGFRIRY